MAEEYTSKKEINFLYNPHVVFSIIFNSDEKRLDERLLETEPKNPEKEIFIKTYPLEQ